MSLLPLACFTEVARLRSVTGAAERLGLSKSAVSKHLTHLEQQLGVRLLARSSRRIDLTPEGQALQPRIESLLAEGDLLFEQARRSRAEPAGLVRIAATPELGACLAEGFVPAVLAAHPELRVAMTSDYRFEDLQDPQHDLAFRIGAVHDEGLVARPLGAFRRVLVAHPDVAGAAALAAPADLARVACLVFSTRDTRSVWRLERPADAEGVDVPVAGRHAVGSFTTLLRLAEAGLGVASLPDFLAGPALRDGRVVRVLPGWCSPPTPVYLAYRVGAERVQRVRVVLDLARSQVPALLEAASRVAAPRGD